MKVEDVMTRDVEFCTLETNLAAAAMQMWERDCGVLPVVDDQRKVIGMITDRDICMKAATNHQDISAIKVEELTSGPIHTCKPDADIREALETLQRAFVRRLPVVNDEGQLEGILSVSDILRHSREKVDKATPGVTYADVVSTFKVISEPRSRAAAASSGRNA
jgi:CBS domain-containing protein